MELEWKLLADIHTQLSDRKNPFLLSIDCFSVFAENKGILSITGKDELVNIKLSITEDPNRPLKYEDKARIKGINGSTIVRDNLNTFLLTNDNKLFAFKSFKRIIELQEITDVKFFDCFQNTCYVLIRQSGIEMKLHLYSSFGVERSDLKCEFDLSYPRDAISIDASRNSEKICAQMIEGPFKKIDETFFTEMLACDLRKETIRDVLLVSIDAKLLWIKYKGSYREGVDEYSIETIASVNENIRGLKYCDGMLLILDELSVLTIFYVKGKLINKKEILLEGEVKCFSFHQNAFIYSNLKKIVFVDVTNPQTPSTFVVNLKGIVCFSVVTELNFIVAICHNHMFYYIPLSRPKQQHKKRLKDEFEVLTNTDIELIPSIARFIEAEEKNLHLTSQKIKDALELKTFLQHLIISRNFSAGDAVITFHQNYPKVPDSGLVICNFDNQLFDVGFIEVKISFSKLLTTMSFTVAFYRQTSSGLITQLTKVVNAKETVSIFLPADTTDDPSNKMSLDVNLNYDFRGGTRLLIYPINVSLVVPFDGPRVKLKNSLDNCLEIINKLKM